MVKSGITNPYTKAGILAVTSKESSFIPKSEVSYRNTSNDRIRSIFTKFKGMSDAELNALKADDEKFFNAVYGGKYGNGPAEGYKYRGRGFNQITFKDNYKAIGNKIGVDLVSNPDKLNDPSVAADALIQFFRDGFDSLQKQQKLMAYNTADMNGFTTAQDSVAAAYHVNTGTGKSVAQAAQDSTGGRAKALSRVGDFVGFIERVVTTTLTAIKDNPVKTSVGVLFFLASATTLLLVFRKKKNVQQAQIVSLGRLKKRKF